MSVFNIISFHACGNRDTKKFNRTSMFPQLERAGLQICADHLQKFPSSQVGGTEC